MILVVVVLIFMCASFSEAHAYIEPGSAGMMLQLIIAGVAGGLFFLRAKLMKIKDYFKKKK